MSRLRFTDGMSFDLQGPLRVEERHDGWYVLGEGMLCPVRDEEDGKEFIKKTKDRIARDRNRVWA